MNVGKRALALLVAGLVAGTASISHATVVSVGPSAFTLASAPITFDDTPDVPLGSQEPTYAVDTVKGTINLTFGGSFVGQVSTDQGASSVTLSSHQPTGPLAIDPNGPSVFTADDPDSATSPVMSGTPLFSGPISILLDHPVAAIGFDAGSFGIENAVTLEAYGADGSILGSTSNTGTGFQFMGLADTLGHDTISGVSIFFSTLTGTGTDTATPDITTAPTSGLEIDNVVVVVPLPEGLKLGLAGLGLVISGIALRRRLQNI